MKNVGLEYAGKIRVDILDLGVISMVAHTVKHLPIMQEIWVWSLGWEDPLEKEMVIHSSILAWEIPWTEEPDELQSMGLQKVGHDWVINTMTNMKCLEAVDHVYNSA